MESKITDEYFIECITKGKLSDQNRALKRFYEDHNLEKMVASFVGKRRGSKDDSDEVLAEAYPKFWQKIREGKFNGTSKLTSYFMGIAKNYWHQQCRRKAKNQSLKFELPKDIPKASDADILEQEANKLYDQVIALVGDRCQKLLRYSALYYPHKEIVLLIDSLSSPNMVKKELSRCKERLQKHIKQNPSIKKLINLFIENYRKNGKF